MTDPAAARLGVEGGKDNLQAGQSGQTTSQQRTPDEESAHSPSLSSSALTTGNEPDTTQTTPAGRPTAVSPGAAEAPKGSDLFGATFGSDTSGFSGLVRRRLAPVSSPKPYGSWFDEAVDALQQAYPFFDDAVLRVLVDRGELTLFIKPERISGVCQHLRDDPDQRYELLSSVSGVHYPDDPDALHAVYHLTSMTFRRRLRLEVAVPDSAPRVPSVTSVYPTADFQEREAWDMFGIEFVGHPGLTRILMPDDWDGHPQRKDYPLGGIAVEYKGASIPPPDERRTYG